MYKTSLYDFFQQKVLHAPSEKIKYSHQCYFLCDLLVMFYVNPYTGLNNVDPLPQIHVYPQPQ